MLNGCNAYSMQRPRSRHDAEIGAQDFTMEFLYTQQAIKAAGLVVITNELIRGDTTPISGWTSLRLPD